MRMLRQCNRTIYVIGSTLMSTGVLANVSISGEGRRRCLFFISSVALLALGEEQV